MYIFKYHFLCLCAQVFIQLFSHTHRFKAPNKPRAVGLAVETLGSITDSLRDLQQVTYLRGKHESQSEPTTLQITCRSAPRLPNCFCFLLFLALKRLFEGGGWRPSALGWLSEGRY